MRLNLCVYVHIYDRYIIIYAIGKILVYKEPVKRPVEEAVADLLNQSFTPFDYPRISVSVGSGGSNEEYEVIGIGIDLPPRASCPRGNMPKKIARD